MRVFLPLALAACCAFFVACQTAEEDPAAAAAFRSFRQDLLDDEVKSVRVLFLPYEFDAYSLVTPEMLRQHARVDREIALTPPLRQQLVLALESSHPARTETAPNLRWGAIFFDAQHEEIHSIYLSRPSFLVPTGRYGIVDQQTLELSGHLADWFQGNFAEWMKARH